MNNSVLVDTNVLIYAIDADSQFHHRALKFLSDPTIQFFITSKNISEFLVVLTQLSGLIFVPIKSINCVFSNVVFSNFTKSILTVS